MEPRFLRRSARSLISTSAPSISYRLEAWPMKILYCPHFLYGLPSASARHQIHPACVLRSTKNSWQFSCDLTAILHCPCHIRDLLTSIRVLCYQLSCRGCCHLANVLTLWQPRFAAVLAASVTAWPLISRCNHDRCGLFNDVKWACFLADARKAYSDCPLSRFSRLTVRHSPSASWSKLAFFTIYSYNIDACAKLTTLISKQLCENSSTQNYVVVPEQNGYRHPPYPRLV